ncbi:MAG: NTP transferase domain-containing protein [Actinomycetota bacterium]|nr:NTP transferase domain-containing protein [Actinomycetota bacterium]
MSIVGVIPAAGYAERLQPLDCSKEVLEVAGNPLIAYLAGRMRTGGATELRVVTRPEKRDVIGIAEGLEASVIRAHPANINESFAAGMAGLAADDIVLLGFPDSLWEPPDGYRALVDAVQGGQEIALGLFDVPGVAGSDYLVLDEAGRIVGIDIKPARPRSTLIWGCAAARVGALEGLELVEWPSEFMVARRAQGAEIFGVLLSDSYVDIGTKESLRQAMASSS